MDAVIEEVLREWSCDDFKSFYEDVFPDGFANSLDATVPETSLDLLSNNSGFFDEIADLSEKYDTMEPEEALFRLLQEDDSAEKVNCEVGVPSPKRGQGDVVVTDALQNWKSKDASSIKESESQDGGIMVQSGKTASEAFKTTSAVTCTFNEVKDNSRKKRKRKASNRGSQTKWKLKKPKGQTCN